ncbi:ATP-dependent DNA helicase PIF1, partial [Brachionus plicatilis]
EQKKTATIFFTFSYADNHWEDLHRLFPGGFSNDPKVRYKNVLNNPHIVDWYFGIRLNEFLKIVFDSILQCEWRWHRYEWQSRSSIHAHGAARFKNDPGLTELTKKVYLGRLAKKDLDKKQLYEDEKQELINLIVEGDKAEVKVINYADTLLSAMNPKDSDFNDQLLDPHQCSINFNTIPEEEYDNDYSNVSNCCQRHTFRIDGYCKSKTNGKCRFEFPMSIQSKTEIWFTETNSSIIAEIKMKRNDPNMNVHNILCCHHWRGNSDMQIIIDKSAAIRYMVKYAAKPEKSSQTFKETYKTILNYSKEGDNPKSKLRSIMLKTSCGQRDIGQCEVCRLLMSGTLYQSSFQYVNQSLDLNNQSSLFVLNFNKTNNDDQIEFKKSLLDFYSNRKQINKNFHNIYNFVDFCQNFQITKNEIATRPNPDKVVIITKPKLRFNPDDIENHRKFCYYQLIKYSAWDSSDINTLCNFETAIQRFENFIKTAPQNVIHSLNFFNNFLKELKNIREEYDPAHEPEMIATEFTELSELVPLKEIFEESPLTDLNYDWKQRRTTYTEIQLKLMSNWIEDQKKIINYSDDYKCPIVFKESLNKMQRFAFNIIEKYLNENKQLLMILNGTAGTGKSFTIFAISTLLDSYLKRCAPTAKAAFKIKGETIHSLFNISVENEQREMATDKLNRIQQEFKDTKFIIIDEYSMLSQKIFACIDKRLKVIKGSNLLFGGISIILVGDPGQLLPVCGSPLYSKNGKGPLTLAGYKAYLNFNIVVKLEKVERQKNSNKDTRQEKFIDLLPRTRNGENTIEDWELLLENSVNPFNIERFNSATRLFLENEKVDQYNNKKLTELNMPIFCSKAINVPESVKKNDSDQLNGLVNLLYLAIGCNVTLTSNIWTNRGLLNSANGVIKEIIVKEDYRIGDLPLAVIVEFVHYIGPQFFDEPCKKNYIPINPISAYSKYANGTRKQLP